MARSGQSHGGSREEMLRAGPSKSRADGITLVVGTEDDVIDR